MEEATIGDFIGIDIGTTSIKCCILDIKSQILMEKSIVHDAWLKNGSNLHREQDPVKILEVLHNLMKSIEVKLSLNVTVSITGQMHGIVLWNGQDLANGKLNCSPLITWMDERVPVEFLDSLPRWDCGSLHIGFGMVTLAWLHSSGQLNTGWTCCGTIMDMIISYLSQSSHSFIGIQNAYSWGYCSYNGHWTVSDELVPLHLLPTICSTEKIVGLVRRANFGLAIGAKLLSSCGDLQSTVYPLLEPGTAVLNLGTSAQLCFLSTMDRAISAPLFMVPFFGESEKTKIVVAASMNGGTNDLKINYEKLNDILNEPGKCSLSTIDIKPIFIPERTNNVLSCISGINSSTTIEEACFIFSILFLQQFLNNILYIVYKHVEFIREVHAYICVIRRTSEYTRKLLHRTACGIVSNLFHLLPPYQLLREWNIERIKLAGNASKNYFIDEIIRQCCGLLEVCVSVDACAKCSAAYGAALHALHFACIK
uniref:FGGY_N domain-containing protein n=1 Tax=Onchocerca volvulus TaxID=6282 RepID=A0A8R1TXZ9_ONCVO